MNEADEHLSLMDELYSYFRKDVLDTKPLISWSDKDKTKTDILGSIGSIVQSFADQMSSASADYAEQMTKTSVSLPSGPDEKWVNNRTREAIDPLFHPEKYGETTESELSDLIVNRLIGGQTRTVRRPSQELLERAAYRSNGRVGWARVIRSDNPCAFCIVMAGRGAVYTSKERALFKNEGVGTEKYHDFCTCGVVMVDKSGNGYPSDYDHTVYEDMYYEARERAQENPEMGYKTLKGSGTDEMSILQALRRNDDGTIVRK